MDGRNKIPGFDFRQIEAIQDHQFIVEQLAGQGHLQGQLTNFFGHLLLIRSGMRSEDHPAAAQYRGFDVAFAGTSRAFLPVEFTRASGHIGTVLDAGRPRPPRCQLSLDDLMHYRRADGYVENLIRQLGLGYFVAFDIYYIYCCHNFPRTGPFTVNLLVHRYLPLPHRSALGRES